MLLKFIGSLAPIAGLALLVAPAHAQTGAAASGKCAALSADYDQYEKAMASRFAESVGDNSAPRATNRAIEDSNSLSQAQITLVLMQASHCTLPDHAPSIKRYLTEALTCSTDRLKAGGADAPSCDMKKWIGK
ncbi:MAG: hypothetical protein ACTHK5_01155 [Tsuneonella sp.]